MRDVYGIAEMLGARSLDDTASMPRDGDTITYYGTATSDSDSGTVSVHLSDDVTLADGQDGTSVELPCTCAVRSGDTVMVTLVSAGNAVRVPTVTGVVGSGDLTRTIAEDAAETAAAIEAHFWSDSWGAHVSSAPNSTEGGNVLIDTDSVDIRDGSTVLASLSSFGSDGGRMTFRGGLEGGGITAHGDTSSRTMTISVGRAGDSRAATLNLIANGENGITNIAMDGSNMVAVGTPSSGTAVTRDLLGVTDRGNISSQSGGAQAQFSTNGYCATLVLGNDTTPSGQWGSKTLCTIPVGYRPILTCYFPVAKTGAAQSMSYVMIDASNGVVTLQNWGGTQSSVSYFCTCTWCY